MTQNQENEKEEEEEEPNCEIVCPFCSEGDFDLIGLKMHLLAGWCEPFAALKQH